MNSKYVIDYEYNFSNDKEYYLIDNIESRKEYYLLGFNKVSKKEINDSILINKRIRNSMGNKYKFKLYCYIIL